MKQGALVFVLMTLACLSFAQHLNLFFDVDKYELSKEHLAQLNKLLARAVTITCIKGYADSTGTLTHNEKLSQKRAERVFNYLNGNSQLNFSPEFLGEQHTAGKELYFDRRVEICFEEKKVVDEVKPVKDSIQTDQAGDSLMPVSERYELSNIYFIPNKAVIEPTSISAVDEAANYLKNFPLCKFEIVGHVNYILPLSVMNNPKAMEPVLKLSEERAKTVYELLAERGISIQHMTYKGVGNSQMHFKHPKNEEEMRKNMRVEILISCRK